MIEFLLVTFGAMWLFGLMVAGVLEVFHMVPQAIEQGLSILDGGKREQ